MEIRVQCFLMTRTEWANVKVLGSTVCADSPALWNVGVNNDGLAAGSGERQHMSEGVCTHLIDRTNAASAINLMAFIIQCILLKSICKIKIKPQKLILCGI